MTVSEFFAQHPRAALGFSGGVDSAYLLYAALQCGAQVQPYFVKTAFQPGFELEDARRLCAQLGVSLRVIELDILAVPNVRDNPPERCYFCKRALFGALAERARQDGYSLLLDGTNASDEATDRPGMRALRELGVRSVLRECGLDKQTIRQLSRQAGLFTWDKPAYACLATRLPTGVSITAQRLEAIEQAEQALYALGLHDFRVRYYHGAARVQLRQEQLPLALAQRQAILRVLRPLFTAVFLDMEVRE